MRNPMQEYWCIVPFCTMEAAQNCADQIEHELDYRSTVMAPTAHEMDHRDRQANLGRHEME